MYVSKQWTAADNTHGSRIFHFLEIIVVYREMRARVQAFNLGTEWMLKWDLLDRIGSNLK